MLHHARVGLGTPADPLATYGQSAASKIITAVSSFPPAQRAAQIQKLLDGIDRTLWPAVNKMLKKGVPWQPALASVFSSHVVSFFTRVGAGQGLSGGLGALPSINPNLLATMTVNATLAPSTPADGACSQDGQFVWRAATASAAGHWERRRAGDTTPCTMVIDTGPTVNTGAQGGRTVTPTVAPIKVGPFSFTPNRNGSPVTWSYDSYDKLSPDQAAFIKAALASRPGDGAYWRPVGTLAAQAHFTGTQEPGGQEFFAGGSWFAADGSVAAPGGGYSKDGAVVPFQGTATWQWPAGSWCTWFGWLTKFGFAPTDSYNVRYLASGMPQSGNNNDPIASFTYAPTVQQAISAANGVNAAAALSQIFAQKWGLYFWLEPVGSIISSSTGSAPGAPPLQPLQQSSWQLNVTAMPLLPGASWFTSLVGDFYSGVIDVAGTLSDIVCGLAANPAVVAGAATAAGGPAAGGAAAAGAAVVKGQCNQGQQPVPQVAPPAPPPSKTPWGYIIAGGLALLGVGAYVLTQPPPRRAA